MKGFIGFIRERRVVILALVFFITLPFFGFLLGMRYQTGKVCTLEAKICPDGSAVGRVLPNCEFSPCPTIN
ncbi:hypothetical protein COW98_04885 [Candidatus Roizmanbacteria bacterium CG22_combo_CG10-13_8_21_14_all_35_9]|uniref:Uncharacterized protein n=2 Tax=Candidatus Roizmaniibacteriota TaxID=1752723 RepID=A0A2H0BXG6_9BACT|nr:MAG: hypothetical protein COW98_04885 [Candidatus Roizmanbacteria bacterium CG22_combo_CG10-13_8_21_14_all_35_9]PIY71242.1 MAG: hypothetical protein COY88_01385 [Candidatus Roizmanbacteria bacterium CG_4_10_14_0_8_um_filter_35_28]